MEPNQKFATVGAFLLAGLGALVVMAMWLGGSWSARNKACYVMRFDNSVAGLSQGSPITFRGVGVGQVQALRINPTDDTQILVRAALDKYTPIKPTTVARLKPQGITGASYIELDVDPAETKTGTEARGECKVIATRPSGIEQIVNRLPQILDNALIVTERLNTLLDSTNVANVSETLANLNALTGQLSSATTAIGPQLQNATGQLQKAMENLNSFSGQLEGNGTTAENLQDTIREAKDSLGEVKSLTEDFRANPRRVLLGPTVNEVKVP